MPFNEDYQQVMSTIESFSGEAAKEYTEAQNSANTDNAEESRKNNVDWGNLVNSFATAAQSYMDRRRNGDGRAWNDFKVDAKVDEGTQKTIILVVCILAGALVFYGLKTSKK